MMYMKCSNFVDGERKVKMRFKLYDSELLTTIEVNRTLALSLIHDQYPDSFLTMLNQLTAGISKCVSVRGGVIEVFK